jgi:hypothetical protein
VPAASDQLLRDVRGARDWGFAPKAVFFANITACLIDTLISKVLGWQGSIQRNPWGMHRCKRPRTSASRHAAAQTTHMKLRLRRPSVRAAGG